MPRPAIRVNQLGYVPAGPKRAVWVGASPEPVSFCVRDPAGVVLTQGRTVPWGFEATSGLEVHVLDFSALRGEGRGLRVEVGEERSHPFAVARDLYTALARDALVFFYL